MSQRVLVVEQRGESPQESAGPLSVGSRISADIRTAGSAVDSDIASIDILDGRPFLQILESSQALSVNGDRVEANRWLDDGDQITAPGLDIACRIEGQKIRLIITSERIEYQTLPPEIVEADQDKDSDIEIAAVKRAEMQPGAVSKEARPRRAPAIVAAALVLASLVAAYLFTSKAVLIATEPADATVELSGGMFKPKFGGRFLLRPGEYRVSSSAPGYVDDDREISVGNADSQTFDVQLQKLPGRLKVVSNPAAEAQVFIDDELVGSTLSDWLLVEPGVHSLRVETERFLPHIGEVDVEGRDVLQEVPIDLQPGWANIALATDPPDATVYVDEEEAGRTPGEFEAMAGRRSISIRKDGYKTWRRELVAVAGEPQSLDPVKLVEVDGLLTVVTQPSGASVSVNKRYRGSSPLDIELAPGRTYGVLISKPGFATVTRQVAIESRKGKTLSVELEQRIGFITIASKPAEAELFIDGKSAGTTGKKIALPARSHDIEIRKKGFAAYKSKITPKPGIPQEIIAELMTPEQAVLAAKTQFIKTSLGSQLRLVGPGKFKMGAPRREQGRRPNESLRDVELTRSFYIGLNEVTNAEYLKFKPKHTSGAEKYSQLLRDKHPAVLLSWEDATGFCNWLSNKDGLPFAYVVKDGEITLADPPNTGYRLPTEAEWVWVTRYSGGGGELKYSWGNRMPPTKGAGNFADNSARSILSRVLSSYNDTYPVTAPVGRFDPNPLGIFDLGGNVAEWVNDKYAVYLDARDVEINPSGTAEGEYHVVRGSSWRHSSISELRNAYRDFGNRGRLDVGFRLARYSDALEARN